MSKIILPRHLFDRLLVYSRQFWTRKLNEVTDKSTGYNEKDIKDNSVNGKKNKKIKSQCRR